MAEEEWSVDTYDQLELVANLVMNCKHYLREGKDAEHYMLRFYDGQPDQRKRRYTVEFIKKLAEFVATTPAAEIEDKLDHMYYDIENTLETIKACEQKICEFHSRILMTRLSRDTLHLQ